MSRYSVPLRLLAGAVLLACGGLAGAQTQNTTRYEYDANGNRTRITDPLDRITAHQGRRLG